MVVVAYLTANLNVLYTHIGIKNQVSAVGPTYVVVMCTFYTFNNYKWTVMVNGLVFKRQNRKISALYR